VRTALVVTLLAVAVLLAACSTSSQVEDLEARIAELEQAATSTTTATTRDISGTLSTPRPRVVCLGGTNLIFEGDRITIHDGSDATLAIDYLSDKTENETEKPADATCTFTFTFPDVPTDQGFYRIRIDDVYWSFNQADLEADDWELELNIRR
jgi:hypothetical protein